MMNLPLKNPKITSEYGLVRKDGKVHTGIDFISNSGDKEVTLINDGTVRGTYFDKNGYGNYVSVQHDDGTRALYCHLAEFRCSAGQRLKKGSVIGIEGTTGNSTGTHLHLELRKSPYTKEKHIDIANYLKIKNEKGNVVRLEKEEYDMIKRYNTIEEIPDYAKETISKLIDSNILKGSETGLDLTEDMIRTFVIFDRVLSKIDLKWSDFDFTL